LWKYLHADKLQNFATLEKRRWDKGDGMTDKQIANLFSMQRDAVIGVGGTTVAFFNALALEQFPELTVGLPAADILPSAVLEIEEDSFSASATMKESPYTILGARIEKMIVYTLIPQEREMDQQGRQLLERVSGTMRRTLTVLNMATEYLMPMIDQIDEPRQRANLTIINKAYYQLQRLCDNLDYFFRFSEGQVRLFLEELDLVRFCQDLIQSVDHFAKRLGARVHFQADLAYLRASIDQQKMTKLILNLISNGLKHLDADGSLTLSLARQGDDAILTLRDTGSGIAGSQIREVFTQYKGSQSDTDIDAGVGLGLGIAQEIARLHGGTLFVTSGADHGTAVRLRIPLIPAGDSGVLQETPLPYREGDGGMQFILMELSDVLDDRAFIGKYY